MQTGTATSSEAGSSPATGPLLGEASFAGLLASLAGPPKREAAWNDDELADDVATISYEQALRAHGGVSKGRGDPPPVDDPRTGKASAENTTEQDSDAQSTTAAKPLKTASITIRLSESECAQLRRRAGEASMTLSAYLRSCTLEVESLRAQVKTTLAELRNCAEVAPGRPGEPAHPGDKRSALDRLWKWVSCLGKRSRISQKVNPGNPLAPLRY